MSDTLSHKDGPPPPARPDPDAPDLVPDGAPDGTEEPEARSQPADPLTPRPSYHPEEGAPDPRSEWFGIVRALLYALLVTAFLTWLIFLWVG